ncbi:MAG: phenylalanine--tRNA ligase subunit beta [Bacteroidales bacterium]
MKISHSWLMQYINVDMAPEQISQILTSIGLEVESLEKIETIKGGLQGVVVGEVLTCEKHPDADKLSITTVNVGQAEPLNVVCGAPNVAKGQKVLVATVGTKLYFKDEEIVIKKAKIRGAPSEGMICAEDELGVGTSHDGIMVLPSDVTVGTSAREYFKIEDDYQYEIGLTPNRIDAASHFGVARDLMAYMGLYNNAQGATLPSVNEFKVDNASLPIPVEVITSSACPRYSGVTVNGVKVGPSPKWLQNRLKSIGLNPINNVVDVTNFVLHEIGQPLHAFDADIIKGNKVVVRTKPEGTPFVTLDGAERKLHADDLMICNESEPMCIAGVFGGLHSGVTEKTTKIFIESACFNPVSVRKTARRHGLNTDASFRFERGTDVNITIWALKRAAMLIKEVAGGTISSEIVDVYPTPVEKFKVDFSVERAWSLIGKEIPTETIEKILKGLEIDVISKNGNDWMLSVPTYRVDVLREADVVEDVLRIYGYNNVEMPQKVSSTLNYSRKPDSFQMQNIAADFLSNNRFNEIMCNSLTKGAYYKDLSTFPEQNSVQILNPLSNDLNVLRQTLLFGGLESIQRNTNFRNPDLKLYEFGNCYKFNADVENPKNPLDRYTENFRLAIWLTGDKDAEHWSQKSDKVNFFNLKSSVHSLLNRFGFDADSLEHTETPSDIFDYGMIYKTNGGKVVATFGVVNSNLTKDFDIKADVFFAEIEWEMMLKQSTKNKISFTELPKYPEVRRDLALLLDTNVSYEQVRKLAYATERKLLKNVSLFDVYQGKNLPEGKKSYAVSFILQDETKTLNDQQIDRTMSRLIEAYTKELGAQLR